MKLVLPVAIALGAISAAVPAQTAPLPPVAPTQRHVVKWHGQEVSDPWFWLRDKDSAPVLDYLKAENAYTEAMTAGLAPLSAKLYAEMLGRIQQTDLDVPVRKGGWYYYNRTVEGQQYPIRCRRQATATLTYDSREPEQVLLDQNELARGKVFISIGDYQVSVDRACNTNNFPSLVRPTPMSNSSSFSSKSKSGLPLAPSRHRLSERLDVGCSET